MRVLGVSDWGRRAQHIVRDDGHCAELLGVEEEGEFHIYSLVVPPNEEAWAGFYSLSAKITPLDERHTQFRLSHRALSGAWQELDVEGPFEFCVRQMMQNRYHLFFG